MPSSSHESLSKASISDASNFTNTTTTSHISDINYNLTSAHHMEPSHSNMVSLIANAAAASAIKRRNNRKLASTTSTSNEITTISQNPIRKISNIAKAAALVGKSRRRMYANSNERIGSYDFHQTTTSMNHRISSVTTFDLTSAVQIRQNHAIRMAAKAAAATAKLQQKRSKVARMAATIGKCRPHFPPSSIAFMAGTMSKSPPPPHPSASISSSFIRMEKEKLEEYVNLPFLWILIQRFEWEAVNSYLDEQATGDERFLPRCTWRDQKGATALHYICSIGGAPFSTVKRVLQGWPIATRLQNKYGETPLHEECKHSQKSMGKVKLLVNHCALSLSILNYKGQSPLHIACACHAFLPVLTFLIQANSSLLLVQDNDGYIPALYIWRSWRKNILGMLTIRSKDWPNNWENDSAVARAWKRMAYVTMKTYSLTHPIPIHGNTLDVVNDYVESPYLLHAILTLEKCPIDFLLAALRKNPESIQKVDDNGNLPLHAFVSLQLIDTKQRILMAWKQMIMAYPDAAQISDHEGRYPLHIALENSKATWNTGLKGLFDAAPDIVIIRDRKTNLYPFMIAATSRKNESCSEKDQINTIYNLLRARPELLKCCTV